MLKKRFKLKHAKVQKNKIIHTESFLFFQMIFKDIS